MTRRSAAGPRRHRARRRLAARWGTASAAVVAIAAIVGAAKLVRLERPGPLLATIERWAAMAGLGLDQVTLTGHRFTSDRDIFEAIDLERFRTMLTFDSRSAQARIEELPWIAHASIERIFPDRLDIHVSERVPVAVWTRAGRSVLIDATGRTLGPIQASSLPALPRIAGDGADAAAAGLFALLGPYPELKSDLVVAEYVGRRRWTLRLGSGAYIHLPVEDEARALAQAVQLLAQGLAARELDLRVPGRPLVREAQLGAPARVPGGRL